MLQLPKYSMGVGDRFARQGKAQLAAMKKAKDAGVLIAPVWNKSYREHGIVGTAPESVRAEADAATQALGWSDAYFVDADHIGLGNVDGFIAASDFFTLDVADFIGEAPANEEMERFVEYCRKYIGTLMIPGLDEPIDITEDMIRDVARTFLKAVLEAGKIYRHVAEAKGADAFVTEVSTDEAATPQTPVELFFILAAVAQEGIPAQTIAPRFSGRFNKGVDYVGDVERFAKEFSDDLAVIKYAIDEFSLPQTLKLSVHSGSDKFSIYGPMRKALRAADAGVHLKTAGTTWLEELIGLALAGGEGLAIAKDIYAAALGRFDELAKPYATVIDIDPAQLPTTDVVSSWSSQQFADALRHDQSCSAYNMHVRQLLHVGYKVAAEMGERYFSALDAHEDVIAQTVTENLFDRHICRLFLDA